LFIIIILYKILLLEENKRRKRNSFNVSFFQCHYTKCFFHRFYKIETIFEKKYVFQILAIVFGDNSMEQEFITKHGPVLIFMRKKNAETENTNRNYQKNLNPSTFTSQEKTCYACFFVYVDEIAYQTINFINPPIPFLFKVFSQNEREGYC